MDHSHVHVVHSLVFAIKANKKPQITNIPLPPCGPKALHSSASGMRVWAWHLLCIPTPECHQWSSEHPEASQSIEVQL